MPPPLLLLLSPVPPPLVLLPPVPPPLLPPRVLRRLVGPHLLQPQVAHQLPRAGCPRWESGAAYQPLAASVRWRVMQRRSLPLPLLLLLLLAQGRLLLLGCLLLGCLLPRGHLQCPPVPHQQAAPAGRLGMQTAMLRRQRPARQPRLQQATEPGVLHLPLAAAAVRPPW